MEWKISGKAACFGGLLSFCDGEVWKASDLLENQEDQPSGSKYRSSRMKFGNWVWRSWPTTSWMLMTRSLQHMYFGLHRVLQITHDYDQRLNVFVIPLYLSVMAHDTCCWPETASLDFKIPNFHDIFRYVRWIDQYKLTCDFAFWIWKGADRKVQRTWMIEIKVPVLPLSKIICCWFFWVVR